MILILFTLIQKIQILFFSIKTALYLLVYYFNILPKLFVRVELIWQEGLLLDFLQKLTIDMWMRKFLIYASYLFNERLVFDNVVRFFLDFIIWPLHYFNIFEVLNIMWVFIWMLGGFAILFNIFILLYLFFL